MRNLLVFVLFLIGLYYVRRALQGKSGDTPGAGREARSEAPRQPTEVEAMVACAHCGVHVPESEGLHVGGYFFCSDAHRRLGPRV